MFLSVDLSLFFNQYANPIAIAHLQWKYQICYCVWLVFELFIVWKFYIETRNTPLEGKLPLPIVTRRFHVPSPT
jgi:hypothetical protein